jgi:hypothetical protein
MDALLRTALADVARIGPYFALDTDPGIAGRPPWRPVTELYGRALPGRIAAAQARLGVEESRVAASLLFQGIAGRLWSPVLGSAVEHGVLPDLTAAGTYWRAASPGPVLLGAPEAGALDADPLAEDLLWGNAASALAGTLAVLSRARPAGAARGRRLVTALLGAPPLRGTGRFGPGGFRRRSCCLYYRVPGGGLCGDCALA